MNPDRSIQAELTFQDVLDDAGGFETPTTSEEITVTNTFTEVIDGQNWSCTTEQHSVDAAGGGTEGFPMFSPNSNVIYPGNLLQGNSLTQGTPNIIPVERAGGTFSTDVLDGNIDASASVDAVTKSAVTSAINTIVAGSSGVVPANFFLKVKNVQSREQLAIELGLEVNSTFVDIETKLGYSEESSKNTFLVNLNQSYYTISYDIPTSLDQVFAPSVTPEDLSKYAGPGNPVCYISDVTYGRIYYMMIESSSTITEMESKINATFTNVESETSADIEVSYLAELEDLSISVFAYGGDASSTLLTVGETNVDELATLLAEASNIESGKALSYVVRNLYDHQIVATQLATVYDVTNCVIAGDSGAPPYTEHWNGQVIQQMGPIGAAFNTEGTEFILINQEGDQYMQSNLGSLEGPFPIDELFGGGCLLDDIGAAAQINFYLGGELQTYIQVFDKTGIKWTAYHMNAEQWGTATVDGAPEPFAAVGVGAKVYKHETLDYSYYFNRDGDRWASQNSGNPSSPLEIWRWGESVGSTQANPWIPFDVGAITTNVINGNFYFILFDKGGTRYVVYGPNLGTVSGINPDAVGVLGPFDL